MTKYPTLALVLLVLIGAATPSLADDQADCARAADLDVKVQSCTRIIESGTASSETTASAYTDRGDAYADMRQFDRAIADYDKAIVLNPTYAMAYTDRGIAYLGKGEADRAVIDFNKAIEVKPTDAMAYNNRGYTYFI